MNPEVKTQWLIDLRSGEFKQGQYMLRNTDNEYCCLGVLAEQAVRAGVIQKPNDPSEHTGWKYDSDTCNITEPVRDWAGLTYGETNTPIGLNDSQGKSFEEIADWIEENL